MFLSTWHPQPLLLGIGPLHIYWYGLLLAIGALVGLLVILRLGKMASLRPPFVIDLFVALVIGGFIGARLYHVLNEWGYYAAHPTAIWQIWNGGLAIHGAMIAGIVILIFMARREKVNSWLLLDVLSVGLVIGQVIGRWGNYFNQELFGRPTDLPWKIIIDPANRPTGYLDSVYYHPTFLYESIGCLILFGLLWVLITERSRHPERRLYSFWRTPGSIALTYFVLYSALRIGMETLRIDRVPIIAGIRFPLLTSALVLIGSLGLLIYRHYRAKVHAPDH